MALPIVFLFQVLLLSVPAFAFCFLALPVGVGSWFGFVGWWGRGLVAGLVVRFVMVSGSFPVPVTTGYWTKEKLL